MKKAALAPVDNTAIEAFFEQAAIVVRAWNDLYAGRSWGRLVLELEGGDKRYPEKVVSLSGDTGTPNRPSMMLLVCIRYNHREKAFVGDNSLLPNMEPRPMSVEKLAGILELFDPAGIRCASPEEPVPPPPPVDTEDRQPCRHGRTDTLCLLCMAEDALKCKHGNPFACAFYEREKRDAASM